MPTTDVPPADEAPAPPHTHRFFTWLRALGVARQPGWVGGVCAGLSARLGIDPIIVRGIVVVAAVLGAPIALLYAAAWLLLPDAGGKVHLEELIHGRVNSALAGIAGLIALALLPVAPGLWWAGAQYWGAPAWGASIGRALWTVVVIGALVAVVVWIARRSGRSTPTPPPTADPAPAPATAGTESTVPPAAPAAGSDPAEFEEWRQRLDAWKASNAAFRAQQAQAKAEERRIRDEANRARYAEYAARAAAQRRIRQLTKPRLSAAWFFVIVGAAIIAGGIAALVASGDGNWMGVPTAAGLAVATVVAGLGAVIVAALGRRSGALGFVTIALVLVTVPTAFIPRDRELIPTVASWNVHEGSYAQLLGGAYIDVNPGDEGVIDLWQGFGDTTIYVRPGVTVHVENTARAGGLWGNEQWLEGGPAVALDVTETHHGDYTTWSMTAGTGTPDVTVIIHGGRSLASVYVEHKGTAPTNGANR